MLGGLRSPSTTLEDDLLRNYVESAEDMTDQEKEYYHKMHGGGVVNSLPDPNDVIKPLLDPETRRLRALERIQKSRVKRIANIKTRAGKTLDKSTVNQAIDVMSRLSTWELKAWCQAEREGQARQGILSHFKA